MGDLMMNQMPMIMYDGTVGEPGMLYPCMNEDGETDPNMFMDCYGNYVDAEGKYCGTVQMDEMGNCCMWSPGGTFTTNNPMFFEGMQDPDASPDEITDGEKKSQSKKSGSQR